MMSSNEIAASVRMYTVDRLTTRQIAELVGVSASTVKRYLSAAGVVMRNAGSEKNAKFDDIELLRHLYLTERKSTTDIASIIGSSASNVSKWLRRHGIEMRSTGSERGHLRMGDGARRKLSEAKRDRLTGSDNPNWRGGTLYRDPERNRFRAKMWVKTVKNRDGWRCVECSSQDRLHAHHIKRWKDYPDLRYEVSNGVTLCHSCHEKAHGKGFKFRWLHARRTPHECTAPVSTG